MFKNLFKKPMAFAHSKFAKSLLTVALASSIGASASAYELKTVFKTEHFAINQVILAQHETLDRPLESAIIGDVQTQNRLSKLYHSSTVIFPAGSQGYTGKINTPILGVLTVANYDTGKDRVYFNRKAQYLTEGALYLSHKQIVEMVNQKTLNNLLSEFSKIPLVITGVPIKSTGFDPTTKSFYITSTDPAIIIDARIDDSVFYSKSTMQNTLREGCTVSMLTFVDRAVANIPVFFSARAAINSIDCSKQVVTKPEAAQAISAAVAKTDALTKSDAASARDASVAETLPVRTEPAPAPAATPAPAPAPAPADNLPVMPSFDAPPADEVPDVPAF